MRGRYGYWIAPLVSQKDEERTTAPRVDVRAYRRGYGNWVFNGPVGCLKLASHHPRFQIAVLKGSSISLRKWAADDQK